MAITINGTTGIAGVDGSAGTPAVQGADPNTGIFYPAADTVAIAAGGSNKAQFGTGSAIIDGLTVGRGAGAVSTNTAVGASALAGSNTGGFNTAVGSSALLTNTTGVNNTATGLQALKLNTTGNNNTATGLNALEQNTTGGSNTAMGLSALQSNTTASNNTAVGYQAAYTQTTATRNTSIGYQAGYTTNDSYNVFVGWSAGKLNTGNSNVVVGDNALSASGAGSGIVAVGQGTLGNNTSGLNNTALGFFALISNTTASNNTAVGYQAGYSNTTGPENTFIGYQAGYSHTTSGYNTFVGAFAGQSVTTGTENQFFGRYAGQAITTGSKNTIIGKYSGNQGGLDIRTASNYIVLSDGDGNPRGIFDSSGNLLVGKTSFSGSSGTGTIVGTDGRINVVTAATTTAFSTYELYSTGAGTYRFYVTANGGISATITTITSLSDQRLKENIRDLDDGLDVVMALKPRKFDWKEGKGADIKNARGFIAQEFETVFPDMVDVWKDPAPEGEDPYKSVRADLIPVLVKAIQELNAKVDAQAAEIAALKGTA
jgi:hypothetical protein